MLPVVMICNVISTMALLLAEPKGKPGKPRSQMPLKKEHFTQEKEHSTQEKEHFTQEKEHFTQIVKPVNPHNIGLFGTFKNPNRLSIDNKLIINSATPPRLTAAAYAIIIL